MKLTKAQIKSYLRNPHSCPVCGSHDISTEDWDAEISYQNVSCVNNHSWKEIFKMVDVEID